MHVDFNTSKAHGKSDRRYSVKWFCDGIYWGRGVWFCLFVFALLAMFLEIPVTLIQTGAFYYPLKIKSLQSGVVNYLMGTTRTGKGIAPSTSTSTQQDKNILESIMDSITRNCQQIHHLHSGSQTASLLLHHADAGRLTLSGTGSQHTLLVQALCAAQRMDWWAPSSVGSAAKYPSWALN